MSRAFIDYSGNTGGGGSAAGRAGVGIPSVPHVSSLADDIEDEMARAETAVAATRELEDDPESRLTPTLEQSPRSPAARSPQPARPSSRASKKVGPAPSNENGYLGAGSATPRGNRSRKNSSASVPNPRIVSGVSAFSDRDELLNGIRALAYGDEMEDEVRSLKMGGSRPPSRAPSVVSKKKRTMSVASVASSVNGGKGGYLFLHDPVDPSSKPTLVHPGGGSRGPALGAENQGERSGRDSGKAGPRVRSRMGLLDESSRRGSVHGSVGGGGGGRGVGGYKSSAVETQGGPGRVSESYARSEYTDYTFTGPNAGPPIHYVGSSENFGPEQAWYFLRALVGAEITHEKEKLWMLTSLDDEGDEADWDDSEMSTVDYSSQYGERRFKSNDVPILRYLIKHFLLTLPFIRDTVTIADQVGSKRPQSYYSSNGAPEGVEYTPAFWTKGILPILQSLHDRDLSQPVDQGRRSLSSIVLDIYGHNALEKFVSAGLKLSSGRSIGEQGKPGYRNSMVNPLLNLQVPRPPSQAFNQPQQQQPTRASGMFGSSRNEDDKKKRQSRGFSMFFRSRPPTSLDNPLAGPKPESRAANNRRDYEASVIGSEETTNEPASRRLAKGKGKESEMDVSSEGFRSAAATPAPGIFADEGEPIESGNEAENELEDEGTSREGEDSATPRIVASPLPDEDAAGRGDGENPTLAKRASLAMGLLGSWTNGLFGAGQGGGGGGGGGEERSKDGHSQEDDAVAFSPGSFRSKSTLDVFRTPMEESFRNTPGVGGGEDSDNDDSASYFRAKKAKNKNADGSSIIGNGSSEEADVADVEPYRVGDEDSKKGSSLMAWDDQQKKARRKASSHSLKASRSPNAPPQDGDWSAAMTLPAHLQNGNGLDEYSSADETEALTVDLVPKSGHAWPWGAPVPFWKGTPVHRVAWGGFEVDVVGVRRGITGHAFLIRVRRPSRLDEYVVRDEQQFKKYLAVLERDFPLAHIRRVPTGKIRPEDDAVDPQAFAAMLAEQSRSRKRAPSEGGDRRVSRAVEGTPERAQSQLKSRLSMRLKEAAYSGRSDAVSIAPATTNRSAPASRRGTISGSRPSTLGETRTTSSTNLPSHLSSSGIVIDPKNLPPYDAQRRALRAWLRDTLSVRTVGHHKETAAFLLLGSVFPKDADIRDMRVREAVDQSRQKGRIAVAAGAAERARSMHAWWTAVENECISGDGFLAISDALRTIPSVDKLPLRFQKAMEWARMNMAQAIHDMLVAGEHSGPLFLKIKALHAAVPWFLLRQAFRVPSANLMAKALQDILLARPFGGKSLLQKVLSSLLDDDPQQLHQQIEACRARIQSVTMCEKLTRFAYAPREVKDMIRKHAAENNLELVVCIVRGADEPRLDKYDLDRVISSARQYKSFMKKNPTPLAKVMTDNIGIRLIIDLQIYLRLISRERDAQEIRGLMAEDTTAEALEVIMTPVMEFIKRTYKIGNMANGISDFQKFLDQLIIIIDALRSRIQDPQKAVRILSRLLARHQQALYTFLHSVHRESGIVEEFFQWGWTAAVFLRRGLAETVDLDALLPQDEEDKAYLLDEIDDMVEFQRKKRTRQYEFMCRRYAADVDGDDPVVVEGDGAGKSRMDPLTEPALRAPRLAEIPRCLDAFRQNIKSIFLV